MDRNKQTSQAEWVSCSGHLASISTRAPECAGESSAAQRLRCLRHEEVSLPVHVVHAEKLSQQRFASLPANPQHLTLALWHGHSPDMQNSAFGPRFRAISWNRKRNLSCQVLNNSWLTVWPSLILQALTCTPRPDPQVLLVMNCSRSRSTPILIDGFASVRLS